MSLIINATNETITLQIFGNYFTWKPGQKKTIRDEKLASYIQSERSDSGLAVIPDVLQYDDEEVSESELAERTLKQELDIEEACKHALQRYLDHHRKIIYNNTVSLRRDLDQANIKSDPLSFASSGELNSMRIVASYQKKMEDEAELRRREAQKLLDQIQKGS